MLDTTSLNPLQRERERLRSKLHKCEQIADSSRVP